MDGWKDGRKEAKAGLRIAYSLSLKIDRDYIEIMIVDSNLSLESDLYRNRRSNLDG